MSFDSLEKSRFDGNKVFLYTWTRGSKVYRFAAADQDMVLDFQTYLANGVIRHGDIEQSGDPIRSPVDVTVDADHAVALLFRSTPPVDTVMLVIQEVHVADLSDRRPVWSGRITSVKWSPENAEAVITHEPTQTSLERTGLRRAYQRLCPLVTGGKRCGINMEAYALEVEVQEVNGLEISVASVSGRPTDYFTGGFLVYEITSGVVERRPIKSQVGTVMTLTNFPVGLLPGMKVKAYPGDDHTADTCAEKFNNIPNYGGFIYFPNKNPFGSSPIY